MDIEDKIFNYDDFSTFMNSECDTIKDDLDDIFKTGPFISSNVFETYNQNSDLYDQVSNAFKAQKFDIKSEPELSLHENNYINIDFDPDEFLSYVKSNDNKSEIPNRNTPSPTHSSESDSSAGTNRSSNESISSFSNSSFGGHNNAGTLDTPPISPQNIISCIGNIGASNTFHNNSIQNIPTEFVNQNTFSNCSIIPPNRGSHISDDEIPVTGMSNNQQNKQRSTIKSKTIVLSTSDYKNLIENCNVKNTTFPKIIIKNINGQVISGSNIKPILPKTETSNNEKSNLLHINEKNNIIPPIMGIIDEKTLKKHERMIKNRKSASISRLKKKDYISSLEQKVNNLEKETRDLKNENANLRSQIEELAKLCDCNKIYHNAELNKKRKLNETIIVNKSINSNSKNSISRIIQNGNLRKNTAVLLAMILMVSLNFGFNFITPQNREMLQLKTSVHLGRGLLSINETYTDNNPSNNTSSPYTNYKFDELKNITEDSRCPVYINQTENLRLASELRNWISVSNYQNLTSTVGPFKHVNDYIESDLKNILSDINQFETYLKRNNQNLFHPSLFRKKLGRKLKQKHKQNEVNKENSVDIYQPSKPKFKHSKLFDQINRRDDTFYLVSFNKDHILLPASAYNKSTRPKMSLMLPTSDPFSRDGKFTLMQIDCEVLNTTMIQLDEKLIPKNLRPKYNFNKKRNENSNMPIVKDRRKFSNISNANDYQKYQNLTATKEKNTFNEPKLYKPYFIKNSNLIIENQTITNDAKNNDDKLPFMP